LISGGILTAANGEKKFFAKGYYQEVLQLIMASRDKKDDTIYNKNLAIVTQILNEQKDNAAIIMTQAQELKNNNNKQNHAAILKRRDKELQHIFTQFSQIEKYVADPKAKREPFDAKTYNIELALYSSKDVQTLQEKIGAQDAEMAKIDAGMFNSALLKLDADDRQDFKVYLSDVIAGTKRPDTDKYTPRNETAFRELCATCPFVLGYINFTDKTSDNKNKNGETVTQE
jgi:hypothetical protein